MARFSGVVGYSEGTAETSPGVFEESIVEFPYFGDVTRNTRQVRYGETVNPDLTVQNTISILADEYANEHFHAIRYVRWAGSLWVVDDVTVERPRLTLRLGGVYHGPTAPAPVTP